MSILDNVQKRLDERKGASVLDRVTERLSVRTPPALIEAVQPEVTPERKTSFLDRFREFVPVDTLDAIPETPLPLQSLDAATREFRSTEGEPTKVESGMPREKSLKPALGRFAERAVKFLEPTITFLGLPITIPANLLLAVEGGKTGSIKERVGRIRAVNRLISLRPQEGDQIFFGDLMKELGITDDSLDKLIEPIVGKAGIAKTANLVAKVGIIGDFIGFSKLDKIVRNAAVGGKPASIFKVNVADKIDDVVVGGEKLPTITPAPKEVRLLGKPKVRSKKLLAKEKELLVKDRGRFEITGTPKKVQKSVLQEVDDILSNPEALKQVQAVRKQRRIVGGRKALRPQQVTPEAPRLAKQGVPVKGLPSAVSKIPEELRPTPTTQRLFGNKESVVIQEALKHGLGMTKKTRGRVAVAVKSVTQKLRSEEGFARIAKDKVVSQRFRTDKFDVTLPEEAQLVAMQESLGLKVRKVQTFGDMSDLAIDLGMDVEALLKTTANPKNLISAAQVKALGNTIKTNMEFVTKTAKKIKEIESLNPIEAEKLQLLIDKSLRLTQQAIKNRIKGGTEAGRAVVAFKLIADNTLDPAFWITRAQRVANKPFTTEQLGKVIQTITEISKNGTPQEMASFIASLKDPSFLDKLVVLWKAGLLSSPLTHAANMSGNVSMAALETISDIPATGLDMLVSMARMGIGRGGHRTVTITPRTVLSKIKAFKRGGQKAKDFFVTGNYPEEILTKYDLPKNIHYKNKYVNGYVQAVMRSLGAEDILFREVAMIESFEKQAILIAKNEIFKKLITKNQFKGRVKELLVKPTNEMAAKAIDTAEKATFQAQNPLARAITGGRKSAEAFGATGEILSAASQVVIPFSRTPTNIAERIFSFSPAGALKPLFRLYKPTNITQELVVKDLGRALTGTSVIATGYYLASKGLMTGNAPVNQRERTQFFAEGKKPNSILIGGKWRQLNRISPLGNLITLGAEFRRLQSEQGLRGFELARQTGFGALKTLTEQTFLRGVSGAIKALNEPERGLEPYLNMMAGSIVPSIIGRVAKTIDPVSRIPENIVQAIDIRIPWRSRRYAIRRDNLGNTVNVPGERKNIIDPFSSSRAITNPVLKEARKIGSPIGLPSNTISGIKLSRMEFSSYQKIQGMILEHVLEEVMATAEYQDSSITDKVGMFEKATRAVRKGVNNTIFPAIMIKRYHLPENTSVEVLRDILPKLSKRSDFKKNNTKEQEKQIKFILSKL